MKWLVTGLVAVTLVVAGFTVQVWLAPLLNFLDLNSQRIEAVTGLIQMLLWLVAGLWFVVRLWRGRANRTQVGVTPGVAAQNGSAVAGEGGQAVVGTTTEGGVIGPGAQAEGGSIVGRDQVNHFTTIYLSAPGRPALDERAFGDALDRYLEWVEKRYGQLNLRGIERREQRVLSLTLDDVYVSLAAVVTPDRGKKRGRRGVTGEETAEPQAMDMRQLLSVSSRLAIIGGPGSGKTTYLHIVANDLARALRSGDGAGLSQHLGLTGALPLPIFVSLSDYNRYRREQGRSADPRRGTLLAFISHALIRDESAIGLPDDFFERLLMQDHACILLLDGLDEVADERDRQLVSAAVANLSHNGGIRQMIVTSRTRAYRGDAVLPEEFRVAEVQPMSAEQVKALAARWCAAAYGDLDTANETVRLQEAIEQLERVRRARGETPLITSPLLTTIVAIVHYNQRRLPEDRAELYEKCVDVLLAERHHSVSQGTFDLADWGGSLVVKRSLLAYLAFCMMSGGEEASRSVDEAQLEAWLRPELVRQRGAEQGAAELALFVEAMRERGSLLDERGGEYRFIHLSFQEYLCAYYLAEILREMDQIVAYLLDGGRAAQAWWRETVLLTVGYLGLRSQPSALALVRGLASAPGQGAVALGMVEVAGAALLELDNQDPTTHAAVKGRLVALSEDKAVRAPGALRGAAGVVLGRLGDQRSGVGLKNGLPDIDWVGRASRSVCDGRRA